MNKLGIVFKLFTLLVMTYSVNASYSQVDFELADRYIESHRDIAMSEMARTGVPASIKLAQGMLESDWGRSDLATEANNHFGIKCGGQWEGDTFYKSDDDRDTQGNIVKSCFRAFDSAYDSFIAHSDFLTDPKKAYRYGALFEIDPTDYKKWAKGLRTAGYASDPKYPHKLIQLIEQYELHQYDVKSSQNVPKSDEPKVLMTVDLNSSSSYSNSSSNAAKAKSSAKSLKKGKINNIKIVYGDGVSTIREIAEANKRKAKQLLQYNEVFPDEDYVPKRDMVVFLQRKKSSTNRNTLHHIVYEGETMASIAHSYGIKLSSLYRKNRMPEGTEPKVGEKLNLFRQVSSSRKPKYIDEFGNDSSDGELLFLDDPRLR